MAGNLRLTLLRCNRYRFGMVSDGASARLSGRTKSAAQREPSGKATLSAWLYGLNPWVVGIGLTLLSWLGFMILLQFPRGFDFDEFHYVPAAKLYLQHLDTTNWEHPPLGKLLMAIGIGTFGDDPFGWRFMSTVFGALTLGGMYFWGLSLFRDRRSALWVALITLANFFLYVQARIGMLDTFMVAFMVWGLALMTASWDDRISLQRLRLYWMGAGACFGFAVASKWSAVVAWGLCIGWIALVKLLQVFGVQGSTSGKKKSKAAKAATEAAVGGIDPEDDWYSPTLWRGVSVPYFIVVWFLIPALLYLLTFVPLLFSSKVPPYVWTDVFKFQKNMYDGQLRVVTDHPYMSKWLSWPFGSRPIWYVFEKEPSSSDVRGVFLVGNPIMMWLGLIAAFGAIIAGIQNRSRQAWIIGTGWGGLYFCWAVIPRKVHFYYYYYPAAMVLSLALAWMWTRFERQASPEDRGLFKNRSAWRWAFLLICTALFAYFWPVLGGGKIAPDEFRKWMWFQSWI